MAKTRTAKPKADNVTNIIDGPKTRKGKKLAHSLANAAADLAALSVTDPPPPVPEAPQAAPDAVRVLKELGALNDRALEAKARYESLKEDTKQARETYDSLASEVLRKIQAATHPLALPLFDAEQRESDLLRMQAGPEDFGAVSAPESVSEGEPSQDTAGSEIVGGAPASEASAPILEDSIF